MKQGLLIGPHAVEEALLSGQTLDKVLVLQGKRSPGIQQLVPQLAAAGVPIQEVPRARLLRVSHAHRGMIGFQAAAPFHVLSHLIATTYEHGEDPLLLVVDRMTDVRNFGAMVRSACAVGVHGLVVPLRKSVALGADALQASAGALAHMPLCRSADLPESLRYMKHAGLCIVAATEKKGMDCFKAPLKGALGLVIGSEKDGISREVLSMADLAIRIPMHGQLRSLNASVAASVLLYEIHRQRRYT